MRRNLTASLRSPRVVLGIVLLIALFYTGLKPFYARFAFVDREPWAAYLSSFPDRRFPGYAELVKAAALTITEGDSVAIVFPTLEWHGGYSYAYYRAQYFLAGRRVVPLSWTSGPRLDRLGEADWAIVFQVEPPPEGWIVEAEFQQGRLLRRAR